MQTSSSSDPRKLLRTGWTWLRRVVIGLLVVLFIFLTMTTVRASLLDGQEPGPLPEGSRLVDVGGRNIHLYEMGRSNPGPAVVLLPCLGCGSVNWQAVQPQLAKTAHVYAYDLAGFAWSDPHPQRLTQEFAADDLHAALVALGEKEVILVAYSGSGLMTLNYLARYSTPPVRGVVWVEGDLPTRAGESLFGSVNTFLPEFLQRAAIELGVGRLFYEVAVASQQRASLTGQASPMLNRDYIERALPAFATRKVQRAGTDLQVTYADSVRRAAALPKPSSIPIFALDADRSPDFAGLSEQEARTLRDQEAVRAQAWRSFAESTPGGRYIPIANSSHTIPDDQPQAVIDAIQGMITLVSAKP
jgi:pimeloyl-ACP methyl ester carboxylesterase